jgi:hypothetical protein
MHPLALVNVRQDRAAPIDERSRSKKPEKERDDDHHGNDPDDRVQTLPCG